MARRLPDVLWIVVDTGAAGRIDDGEGGLERSLRFAATLADHALIKGYLVGLALARSDGPRVLRPAAGRGQRRAVLDALADADAGGGIPLATTLGAVGRGHVRRAEVVIVTPDAAKAPGLSGVRAACRHLTVIDAARMSQVFQDPPAAPGEAT
jgi:uncharacterized protein (DUF58 family)